MRILTDINGCRKKNPKNVQRRTQRGPPGTIAWRPAKWSHSSLFISGCGVAEGGRVRLAGQSGAELEKFFRERAREREGGKQEEHR